VAGSDGVTDPAVQALISAINGGDRAAFFDALAPGATMSDDGTDRDLARGPTGRSSPPAATLRWSRPRTAAGP
jgi:hypothetical protein